MTKSVDTREIVLDILFEIIEKEGYSHLLLRQALTKYQYLDKQDRSFITRLTEGTLEYLIQIDYIINNYSKIKISKMKPIIRTILRMSVYQIRFMESIPDSAACNEAVKLVQKRGFQGLKGFVNGVLRTIIREGDNIPWPKKEQNRLNYYSIYYSMPEWIVRMWAKEYNEATLEKMLEAFLSENKTTIRCNLDKASKVQIIESLKKEDIGITECELLPDVLWIYGYDTIDRIGAFQKGLIQVQDFGSCLVGELAAPSKGDYVIDVCAAPGGKSLHIAHKLKGSGFVDARDLSQRKVQMIVDNINRTNPTNIKAKVQDALIPDPESVNKADIVIADLPCSGLGIIGKKTDIKYKVTPERLGELVKLQRDILSNIHSYVKPGGTLVYSTCTINRAENIDNVTWFLEHFPFEPINISERLGSGLDEESSKEGWIQLLPGIHPSDGFFIAVMRRL